MQLICEAYHFMKDVLQMSAAEMHQIFSRWNEGVLSSYLVEITSDILAYRDDDDQPLIDKILDTAGQKGTGKWTVIAALEAATPLSLISESVFARCISAMKDERLAASATLSGPDATYSGDKNKALQDLEQALYMAKMVSYAQGFNLMREASIEYKWNLNFGEIARIWRGGCIIRSVFLDKITAAFKENSVLDNLLLAPFFKNQIVDSQQNLRRILVTALQHGIPVPCHSAALNYYDSFRSARLPANLLQAQRDYFGAHTYERLDKPRGQFFHTNWTGEGGDTTSTAYNR
jgi:6-phosphogluconate dehydrogenase